MRNLRNQKQYKKSVCIKQNVVLKAFNKSCAKILILKHATWVKNSLHTSWKLIFSLFLCLFLSETGAVSAKKPCLSESVCFALYRFSLK